MSSKLAIIMGAMLVAGPAFAQSVTVVESEVKTQPLSPSLGGTTGSLAIITPEQAGELTTGTATLDLLPADEQEVLDSLPRITPAQAATIVGTPSNAGINADPLEEDVTVYVVEDGTILPESAWNQQQRDACKASGGVEIPIPGDRIACIKL